jgi:integrase
MVFNLSYGKMSYWIRKLSAALGFATLRLTSHSFRRGGASYLLASGLPVADVCVYGRWNSMSSAQEYLRQGEVYMTRMRGAFSAAAWARIDRLASLRDCVWDSPEVVD